MVSGVSYQEVDSSFQIPLRAGGRYCAAGPCRRGPIGSYVDIDTSGEFKRIYGGVYTQSKFGRYCLEWLDTGAKLRISRVAHATDPDDISTLVAVLSTQTLVDRAGSVAGPAVLTSNVANPGPWLIPNGTTFTLDIDGTPEATATVSVAAATVTTTNAENAGAWDITADRTLEIQVGGSGQPVQIATLPSSEFAVPGTPTALELAAAINSPGRFVGLSAVRSGSGPAWTVTIESDQQGSDAKIRIVGGTLLTTGGVTISTTEQTGSGDFPDHRAVTPAELATYLQGANHGVTYNNTSTATAVTFTSVATGAAIHMGFDAPSTGAAILGLTEGAGGDVVGTASSSAVNTLRVDAINEGVWADNLAFDIGLDPTDPTNKFTLTIPVQAEVPDREYYEDLSMDSSSSRYVVTVVNALSKAVRITDLSSATVAPNNQPLTGSFVLAGGDDGLTGLVGADFEGGTTSKLGVHAFDGSVKAFDLFTPTIHEDSASGSAAAAYNIAEYCKTRRDLTYMQAPPNPENQSDTIAYRDGTAPYAHQKYDNNYSALYFGNGDVPIPGGTVKLNTLAGLGGVLSYNDTGNGRKFNDVGMHFAPAGLKRGKTRFRKAYPSMALGDPSRSTLEDKQINYPLDHDSGIYLWNQATLQLATSALSDLNVRRGMIFMATSVVDRLLEVAFDPNDPTMWRQMFRSINPFMEGLLNNRALYDYRIFCDQDVDDPLGGKINTPALIDQGICKCLIFVKPTRAAKEIPVVFTITATGVDYDEVLDGVV